jgi:hypothetical protein
MFLRLSLKKKEKTKERGGRTWTGDEAQVVKHFPSKCKALQIPALPKKKKAKKPHMNVKNFI